MNRRQEIASWVFGLLLAAALATGDRLNLSEDTIYPAAPLAIVGALAIYSLRPRGSPGALSDAKILMVGAGVAGALAIAAQLRSITERLPDTTALEDAVSEVAKSVDDVKDAVSNVGTSVDDVATNVGICR